MKFLKIVLGAAVCLGLVFAGVGFLLPSRWEVKRSTVINAPPEVVYPFVANLKTGWPRWSLFDYEDPDIAYSYSGPDEGVGAEREWISDKMGNGTQRITKADPKKGVEFELTMDNGFALTGRLDFDPFETLGVATQTATEVTWTDTGDVGGNLLYRWMALFMDAMMGDTFETSLETLKREAEIAAASPA
jgi:hypothetical protein